MTIVTVIIFVEIMMKKISFAGLSKFQINTLIPIGIFSTSFNYFMQVGFDLAPNVGYVNATNAASISLLTLMSAILFKDDLSLKKMAGIAGVTIGLFILFL